MKMLTQISHIKASRVLIGGLFLALMLFTQACNDAVSALDEAPTIPRLEQSLASLATPGNPSGDQTKEEDRNGGGAVGLKDKPEIIGPPDRDEGDDDESPPEFVEVGVAHGAIEFVTGSNVSGLTKGAVRFDVIQVAGDPDRTARGSLTMKTSRGIIILAEIEQAAFNLDGTATFSGPVVGGNFNSFAPVSIFVRIRDGGSPRSGNDRFVFLIANPDEISDGILPEGAGTEVKILDGDILVKTRKGHASSG